MEITIRCPDCAGKDSIHFAVKLEQKNDCVHEVECPRGHRFKINIAYHPFQKLFEIAVYALADGYFRESIGSFAASYERFLELFVRIVHQGKGIEMNAFDATWKKVSRQSERQLGAFLFTFLYEFGEPPTIFSEKNIYLRNRVIHQGYIPLEQEAIDYGNEVLSCITSAIRLLFDSEKHRSILIGAINEYVDFGDDGPLVTYFPYHMIGTNRNPDDDPAPVEDHLARIRAQRAKA